MKVALLDVFAADPEEETGTRTILAIIFCAERTMFFKTAGHDRRATKLSHGCPAGRSALTARIPAIRTNTMHIRRPNLSG